MLVCRTIDIEAVDFSSAHMLVSQGLAPAFYTEMRITFDFDEIVKRQVWMVPLFATAVVLIYNQGDIRTPVAGDILTSPIVPGFLSLIGYLVLEFLTVKMDNLTRVYSTQIHSF